MKEPILINVVGPTAIGKTSLAIKLAQHFNTEILSADSRQFYKELSIGTAAPDEEELAAAKHHFIHNRSISEDYSVGAYEKDALVKLDELFTKYNPLILVGGSGLYVDAVNKGLNEFPDVKPEVKESLQLTYEKKGIAYLQEQLQKLDPEYYQKVDIQNHVRLLRALEVCLSTGKPYSSYLNQEKPKRKFKSIYIGLKAAREVLYARINKRVDLMVEAGLLEEVKSVLEYKDKNALQTVGYSEVFKYLDKTYDWDTAVSEIKKNSRRYAKRQMTWFNRNPDIIWFDYQTDFDDIIKEIKNAF